MVEMDEKKFKKFVTGKMQIEIGDDTFSIDLAVEERLPVLSYLVNMAKFAEKGQLPKQEMITDAKNILIKAFKRNYSSVDEKVIKKFVDAKFEEIVVGISTASGWISKEQLKKQIDKLSDKKKA